MPDLLEFPLPTPVTPTPSGGTIGVIYQQPPLTPVLSKLPAVSSVLDTLEEEEQQQELMGQLEITRRRREILAALAACQDLTIDQLQQLLRLSPASIPYLREHLRALEKEGYVEVGAPAKQTFYGRAPNVYTYGPEAIKLLKKDGVTFPKRYRPLKERLHAEYPVRHTLAVNDVYIRAKNLKYEVPEVRLKDSVHESVLNGKPLRIKIPGREKLYGLSPDLWLHFSHTRWDYFCCVELNLSKVGQTEWRERVRAYLYSLQPYRERFGTSALVVLTIIESKLDYPKTNTSVLTSEEILDREEAEEDRRERLRNMLKWTEAELTALSARSQADMFWFTDTRLHDTPPKELFYGAHWRVPFWTTPAAPLPPGREADSA